MTVSAAFGTNNVSASQRWSLQPSTHDNAEGSSRICIITEHMLHRTSIILHVVPKRALPDDLEGVQT